MKVENTSIPSLRVINVVSHCKVPTRLNYNTLLSGLPGSYITKPKPRKRFLRYGLDAVYARRCPSCVKYTMERPRCVFMIFRTGKINIMKAEHACYAREGMDKLIFLLNLKILFHHHLVYYIQLPLL